MKIKSRKTSLIVATAMFVFSGIFGLAEAAQENEPVVKFNKVHVINKMKYDVWMAIAPSGTNGSPHEAKAGRSEEYDQKGDLSYHLVIGATPSLTESGMRGLGSDLPLNKWKDRFVTYFVLGLGAKNGKMSSFTVGVKLDEETLNVIIDSEDEDLKYKGAEGN